jgi:hypothetical protein
MVALLLPPCNSKIFKVRSVVGNDDPRFLKSKDKLLLVGVAYIACVECRNTLDAVGGQQLRQEDINILIEIHSQRDGASHHCT